MRNVQELSPVFKPSSSYMGMLNSFKHAWDVPMDRIKRCCHLRTWGKGTFLSCFWYFICQTQVAHSSCVGWQEPATLLVQPLPPLLFQGCAREYFLMLSCTRASGWSLSEEIA